MKNKIILICSVLIILALGIFYVTNNNLIADDKDGKKDCSSSCTDKTSSANKSGCTDKNMSSANTSDDPNANNTYAVYEFVTDKIHCDGCKTEMTENLMGVAGIKDISYGETCKVSQMTSVKVFYSAADTTPEIVAASVKEKGLTCDESKCSDKTKTEKKL